VISRDPLQPTLANRARHVARSAAGEMLRGAYEFACSAGAIGPDSRRGRRFGSFGAGTVVCFPYDAIVNEGHIHLGAGTMIGPHASLSAGWEQGHPGLSDVVLRIGDRGLIGRGSCITAHRSIDIGDDVWTGGGVYITDMNHGYLDLEVPISRQFQAEAPVTIESGTWLGYGCAVLPGVHVGRHCVVGAGSVVTKDLPDYSVAVGVPAQVIRRYAPDTGWTPVERAERAGIVL
jgi:acetyltransferase-like isoleucine patch superfamily enzyme